MKLLNKIFANKPTGPCPNDLIAGGSAYLGNLSYGLVIFSPSPGTAHHNKQVVFINPAVLSAALSVTVTSTLLTVNLGVEGYNPVSTLDEIAAAINATRVPHNHFGAVVVSNGNEVGGTIPLTNLANGSNSPAVAVGQLYYTPDGTVKRRMA